MKYIMIHDFSYLFHRRIHLIMLILSIPALLSIFYFHADISFSDWTYLLTGTNLQLKSITILDVIIYLCYQVFYLFLAIDLYLKDLKFHLDYIFCRMSCRKWYLCKISSILLFGSLFKIVEYSFVGVLGSIQFSQVDIELLYSCMWIDLLYAVLGQLLFLLFYLSSYAFSKIKYGLFILLFIIVVIIPKNIISMLAYQKILPMIMLLLFLVVGIIFVKKNRKLFQMIGER